MDKCAQNTRFYTGTSNNEHKDDGNECSASHAAARFGLVPRTIITVRATERVWVSCNRHTARLVEKETNCSISWETERQRDRWRQRVIFFPIAMFTEQAGKFCFALGPPWVLTSVRWRDGMNGKDLLWTLWYEHRLLRRVISYHIISSDVIWFRARRWKYC
jgi:hypothetical protein